MYAHVNLGLNSLDGMFINKGYVVDHKGIRRDPDGTVHETFLLCGQQFESPQEIGEFVSDSLLGRVLSAETGDDGLLLTYGTPIIRTAKITRHNEKFLVEHQVYPVNLTKH